MELKKYVAELVGTFALALIVLLIIASGNAGLVPFMAGLMLALLVYTLGHISGAHVNPGVTVGAWSIGKIKHVDALWYIVAQFAGAALAFVIADAFTPIELVSIFVAPEGIDNSLRIGLAEALGMFFFTFGIASVVYKRNDKNTSGLIIGASLAMGIIIAALSGASGILNPAVALSVKSLTSMYILGPVVGSIVGMWAYKLFEGK